MLKYIIKRFFISIIVLIGVSIIVFTLLHMQPGNPYIQMLSPNISPEQTEKMLRRLGYYDPLPIKYLKWIKTALFGNFGYSIQYKKPVLDVISSRAFNTFILALVSSIISLLIAIPSGIISASKENTFLDYLLTTISFLGISIPSFFFGLLLIKILAFNYNIFPISGMQTLGSSLSGIDKIIDISKHMVLPAIVLSFMNVASLMRYTRSSMLDVLSKDFMRTARAKGLTENQSIIKHGFRNALIPITTILCMQIPFLFSGALITETIFIWPGIGRLNYEAILNRDYPLIMGILMIIAVVIIISNFLADVLYVVVDPRIRIRN